MNKKYPYTNVDDTPLLFYKFVKITLIIGLIIGSLRLISFLANFQSDFEHVYLLVIYMISLVLAFVARVGLSNMDWSGPLCYMAGICILPADAMIGLAGVLYYRSIGVETLDNSELIEMVSTIVVAFLLLIPIWIYFRKRRLLFKPLPDDAPSAVNAYMNSTTPTYNINDDTGSAVSLYSDTRGSAYSSTTANGKGAFPQPSRKENDSTFENGTVKSANYHKSADQKEYQTDNPVTNPDRISDKLENRTTRSSYSAIPVLSTLSNQDGDLSEPSKNESDGSMLSKKRFCHRCGTRLQPGALFCTECGTKIQ